MWHHWYFNSRPHEEVDLFVAILSLPIHYFNSRPHEEVDEYTSSPIYTPVISTHDLTKRSTYVNHLQVMNVVFQLTTSRRGRQHLGWFNPSIRNYFNSRPHEEVDRSKGWINVYLKYFNSRPHEEVDFLIDVEFPTYRYFNSRPHEEVDENGVTTIKLIGISTHDLTKRSTKFNIICEYINQYFNSRPHEEVDLLTVRLPYVGEVFQLTTSRRGRLYRWLIIVS